MKDTNIILNEIVYGSSVTVRLDTNAILNALYDGTAVLPVNIQDFDVTGATDGQVLAYDAADEKFKPADAAAGSDVTLYATTTGDSVCYFSETPGGAPYVLPLEQYASVIFRYHRISSNGWNISSSADQVHAHNNGGVTVSGQGYWGGPVFTNLGGNPLIFEPSADPAGIMVSIQGGVEGTVSHKLVLYSITRNSVTPV